MELDKLKVVNLNQEELLNDWEWWGIYELCFPSEEREGKEIILKSLGEAGKAVCLKYNSETIGIATFQYLPSIQSYFMIYFAIGQKHQGQKLGPYFLNLIFNYISKEQDFLNSLIWEVEKPCGDAGVEIQQKRILFFEKSGAELLDVQYTQPPVDGKTLVPMHLMQKKYRQEILPVSDIVNAIYFEKYAKVNGIGEDILNKLLSEV